MALDGRGNLFIADYNNSVIRRVVLSTGVISTFAGSGNYGYSGDNGPALKAGLDPYGIAQGNIYIADSFNDRIRKITAADGIITTIAGTGVGADSGDNGPAAQAQVNSPSDVSVDPQKAAYFAEYP